MQTLAATDPPRSCPCPQRMHGHSLASSPGPQYSPCSSFLGQMQAECGGDIHPLAQLVLPREGPRLVLRDVGRSCPISLCPSLPLCQQTSRQLTSYMNVTPNQGNSRAHTTECVGPRSGVGFRLPGPQASAVAWSLRLARVEHERPLEKGVLRRQLFPLWLSINLSLQDLPSGAGELHRLPGAGGTLLPGAGTSPTSRCPTYPQDP